MNETLSREIIKWLEGLQLSYSFLSIKRDFSNGFLVAEILCRYFDDQVIRLESFEYVSAIATKRHNWDYILKIFKIIGFEIENVEEISKDIVEINFESASQVIKLLNALKFFLTSEDKFFSTKVPSKNKH